MAYFIDPGFGLTGISLTTPGLYFHAQLADSRYQSSDPPRILAIPAETDSCEAGILVWMGGFVERFNGPTTWPPKEE